MSILSNIDLTKLLNKFNINDVLIISKDELSNYKNNNKFIINMSDKLKKGTHWVCLYDNYYFDSYGLEPPIDVEQFINKNYYYNNQQYQFINSTNCGWYCLIFFMYFNKNKINKKNYNKFCDMFNISNNNDEIIINYINNYHQ